MLWKARLGCFWFNVIQFAWIVCMILVCNKWMRWEECGRCIKWEKNMNIRCLHIIEIKSLQWPSYFIQYHFFYIYLYLSAHTQPFASPECCLARIREKKKIRTFHVWFGCFIFAWNPLPYCMTYSVCFELQRQLTASKSRRLPQQ